jgi:hypothetical protein
MNYLAGVPSQAPWRESAADFFDLAGGDSSIRRVIRLSIAKLELC